MIFHPTLFILCVSFKNVQKNLTNYTNKILNPVLLAASGKPTSFLSTPASLNFSERRRWRQPTRSVGSLLVLTASVRPELYQTENVHIGDRKVCLWEQTVWTLLLQVERRAFISLRVVGLLLSQ